VNVCINNGVVNYDEVYFHIVADADFTLWGNICLQQVIQAIAQI
jgi:hypothetical protein